MSNTKTSKDEIIPLYYQLEVSLRSRLASGEFAPGDRLPSEAELGKEYKVSRITVRQAFSALKLDGLVSRQRGRGTFVTDRVKKLLTPKLVGSLDDAINLGLTDKYEIRLLSRQEAPASRREAQLFGIDMGQKVHRIQRIRLYEGQPLAYIVNFMPLDVGSRLSSDDLLNQPVLANLEMRLGLKLEEADQRIGAALADSRIAGLLKIRTGDPLLQIERTVYEEGGRAVNHVVVLFRADNYLYQVKLRRTRREGKSDWSLK